MDGLDLKLLEGLNLVNDTKETDNDYSQRNDSSSRGVANTGPKGVLNDYKAHQLEEESRRKQKKAFFDEQFSKSGLSSGWNQRTIESEKFTDSIENQEDEENIDELIRQLEEEEEDHIEESNSTYLSRLVSLTRNVMAKQSKPQFGSLITCEDEDEYLNHIESADPTLILIVHLSRSHLVESRLASNYLAHLASLYPEQKFIEFEEMSVKIPSGFYPVIMAYRGGEVVSNLVGEINRGEGGFFACDMLEKLLLRKGVLNDRADEDEVELDE
jgi:hypothetical protein